MSQKNFGQALKLMEKQGNPTQPLEMAKIYLLRRQYEGVKAVVAKIPADSPDYPQGRCSWSGPAGGNKTIRRRCAPWPHWRARFLPADFLMEKARTLEAMGDKKAVTLYQEIINIKPDSQAAQVARAREPGPRAIRGRPIRILPRP